MSLSDLFLISINIWCKISGNDFPWCFNFLFNLYVLDGGFRYPDGSRHLPESSALRYSV